MKNSFLVVLPFAVLAAALPAAAQTTTGEGVVRINDFDMHYEVRGTGEPLLLLHGFGGCAHDWQPLADSLSNTYQLIIPDLRGHGASTNPSGTFTHRQAALDVFALLDRLNVQRFAAIGVSAGGMTLLHMATQQPERVEAMVLVSATTHFPDQARAAIRSIAENAMGPATQATFGRCVTRGDAQVRQLAAQFGAFADNYEDMNFTARSLETIRARSLIVHGDRDPFFPVDIAVEMYRAIPGSALWIVPQAGHGFRAIGTHTNEFRDRVTLFLRGDSR